MQKRTIAATAAIAAGFMLAGTGGAVAGGLITSAQIKDGTIKSADVKNGSLKGTDVKNGSILLRDLSPGARAWIIKHAGVNGANGVDGAAGTAGSNGTAGAKGDKGENGQDGAKGDTGDKGDKGADGTNGTNGVDGAKGDPGQDGAKGDKGDAGEKGDPGKDGQDGKDGAPGSVAGVQTNWVAGVGASIDGKHEVFLNNNLEGAEGGSSVEIADVNVPVQALQKLSFTYILADGATYGAGVPRVFFEISGDVFNTFDGNPSDAGVDNEDGTFTKTVTIPKNGRMHAMGIVKDFGAGGVVIRDLTVNGQVLSFK